MDARHGAGPPTAASGPVSCSQEGKALGPKSASLHVPTSALLSEIPSHFHSVSSQWDPGLALMENSSPRPMTPAADLCHPLRLFVCPDHHPLVAHGVSFCPSFHSGISVGPPCSIHVPPFVEEPATADLPHCCSPGAWCHVNFH